MRSSQKVLTQVGLSNKLIETSILPKRWEVIVNNRRIATRFSDPCCKLAGFPLEGLKRTAPFGYYLENVPVGPILGFFKGFTNHPTALLSDPELVIPYIESRPGEMQTWDVLIPSLLHREPDTLVDKSILGTEVDCQRRREGTHTVGKPDRLAITQQQGRNSRGGTNWAE